MDRMIAPSLLSADFGKLREEIEMINSSEADWFHIDVMDGVFVPNITFGFPVIHYIKKYAKKPLDVHLMIVDPGRYIEKFRGAGADILTVHYEACTHLHRTIHQIKDSGMLAGAVLNPHSSVTLLEDILPDLDLILIMSVNPGFAAQKFIPNTFKKVQQLSHTREIINTNFLIEVDGGVDLSNAGKLFESGVNVLVAGNCIFSSPDPVKTIRDLKKSVQ
ncbi:MAG: ribulose-phosphate 3-epimerase [Bacteroidetes bacterium]|nr:ribulose-phosphate 3-epimerase [Bacteroidota bacterium]